MSLNFFIKDSLESGKFNQSTTNKYVNYFNFTDAPLRDLTKQNCYLGPPWSGFIRFLFSKWNFDEGSHWIIWLLQHHWAREFYGWS